MTYITNEPIPTQAFADQVGGLHRSRDLAIDANFESDFRKAVGDVMKDGFYTLPFLGTLAIIKKFAREHPDMLRVLIGDRDPT